MIEPAIVVIAYNRVKPLKRLLKSLAGAHYPSDNIVLHISIDASDTSEIEKLAREFTWTHGEKIIDVKTENRGLLKHVLECGSLTEKYDSIIVLEDDLLVAPGFYQYAQSANAFYSNDEKIAGVSLFTYPVEENNFHPFQPIRDDSDVHFIQVASSWGQSWSKDQWSKFKSWLIEHPSGKEAILPAYIMNWGNNSWKKLFISYLIDTNRYFVFPNTSYSTNFEEEGTHASSTGLFQVAMHSGLTQPRLKKWSESNSVYDVYFELIPDALKRMMPQFSEYDLEVDLYGKKPLDKLRSELILTVRRGVNPIRSFGATMEPLIQNVIFEIDGNEIVLIDKTNISTQKEPERFVEISESIVNLRRNAHVYSSNQKQVTVVIPALNEKQLQHTMDHLYKDRFHHVTVLICCHPELAVKFDSIEQSLGCRVKWVHSESSDVNQLLRKGFDSCMTEYMSWVQAGMEINLKKFEKVAEILSGMKQVNFVRGIDEEVTEQDYLTKNSAKWRMTSELAYSIAKRKGDIASELTVFRRTIFDEVKDRLNEDCSNLFLEILKVTPLYVLVDQLGIRNGIGSIHSMTRAEMKECMSDPKFKRNSVIRMITKPFIWHFFHFNVPFFRLFYKEIERFPMVIRYDFKNDSYFLANY